jgi:DNA-binding IclR family transcriptional regulator
MSILMLLSREDESLTGLSKSLGLQKGHLQFHLKILLEPGFINYDRKSRLYSITAKGSTALDGIGRLVESLA